MKIILVDDNDKQIGTEEKLKAHKEGKLHRAFSIFIFNSKNELLLQKRADFKYHSGGLWTNTCCSHPRPYKNIEEEAKKRLEEEMGIKVNLKKLFTFKYKSSFTNGLTEHEYDHVFIGRYDNDPVPNADEVSEWKWVSLKELKKDVKDNPDNYTEWLKICLDKVINNIDTA